MNPLFALIDCDNFFVSCERIFRPDLEGRPVVVLSSNDGCAVARSNEAKALGIPMGAPIFKYRQLFKENGVIQFSANFELYGDISDRITRFLLQQTPRVEVYSVDESFLDLSQLQQEDFTLWGQDLRERIGKTIGVPVSIGIAPTKTLAKLASERAKKDTSLGGVLELPTTNSGDWQRYLSLVPIEDVWGIGRRLSPRLRAEGVRSALELAQMNPHVAQQLMGVRGRQLVTELSGISCFPLGMTQKTRQSIMHGRMFGEDTSEFSVLEAAITSLAARSAYRLRQEKLVAVSAVLQLSTNRHKPGYQRLSRFIGFKTPSADTGTITSELMRVLLTMYRPGLSYHRANIVIYDLQSEDILQADLFGETDIAMALRSHSRMQALDEINGRYGASALHYAAQDLSKTWQPKHQLRSPRYTSAWDELPTARIRP